MENSSNIEQKITVRISDKMNKVKTKEDMIAKLTEEHPEAGEMIRQIVLSYHN